MSHLARRRSDLRRTRALRMLALCGALIFASGCETDPDSGGLVPSCLTFINVTEPTDGLVTGVWGADSTCDTALVELIVTGVDDVWGTSFEIVYPSAIAQFISVSAADSFLNETGVGLLIEAQEIESGRVEIGVTRVDSDNHKGVTPTAEDNLLVRMTFFRFAASGQGAVTLEDASLSIVAAPGEPSEITAPFGPDPTLTLGNFFVEN